MADKGDFAIDLDFGSMSALGVVFATAVVKLGIGEVLCIEDKDIAALSGKAVRCRRTQDGFVITVEPVLKALSRAAADPEQYLVHDFTKDQQEAPGSGTKH